MMKKLTTAITAILLALTMALPAYAMTPSRELGAAAASATITDSSGASRPIETVVEGITIDEEAVPLSGGITVEQVETAARPYIKVTPVEQTMDANDKYDKENGETKPFSERLDDPTESGLRYGKNNDTNLVYLTAQKSASTTEFLSKFPEGLVSMAEEQIETLRQEQLARFAEQRAALAAELDALTDESEKTAKQADLDALDARTARWQNGEAGKLDDYAAIGLFDITASAGAIEEMGENGKVNVEIEITGITEESSLLAVHFFGELADPEAVRTALEEDFANALVDFDYELLPVVAEDGKATVTMTHFSPVMIFSCVEEADTAQLAGSTEGTDGQNGQGGNNWWWLLLVAAGCGAGGYGYYNHRKKKTAAASAAK